MLNKEQRYLDYMKGHAIPQAFDQVQAVHRHSRERSAELVDCIVEGVLRLLDEVRRSQGNGDKGPVLCIGIHILRTEILTRQYRILLAAYDGQFLYDPDPIELYLDFAGFFKPLDDMYDGLSKDARAFSNLVKDNHVNLLVQDMAGLYRVYLTEIARLAMKSLAGEKHFEKIHTADKFFIICG